MSDLSKFFARGTSVRLSKKEVILRGDETDSAVYFISRGFVKVYSINDEGEEYLHIIYKQGDIFPLIWAFKDKRRRVFYQTMTDAVLFKLPKDKFIGHIRQNSDAVVYSLLVQMANQFNIYADRLDNLQYRNAGERVVYRLLFLAGRFGLEKGSGILIDAPLTHKTIAQSINLTRESVSREIERLTKKGLLEIKSGRILIKDVVKLSGEFSEPVSLDLWGLNKLS